MPKVHVMNTGSSRGFISAVSETIERGTEIFREVPLFTVQADFDNSLFGLLLKWSHGWDLATLWYWAVLSMIITDDDHDELCGMAEYFREQTCENADKLYQVLSAICTTPFICMRHSTKIKLMDLYVNDTSQISHGIRELARALECHFQLSLISNIKDNRKCADSAHYITSLFTDVKLERYLQIWTYNCFEGEVDGFAIYRGASLFNHSCAPNCIWVRDKEELVLIANSRIEAGTELTISYLSDAHNYEFTGWRNLDLLTTKNFNCRCSRCEQACDFSRGYLCQNCDIGIWFMPSTSRIGVPIEAGTLKRLTSTDVDSDEELFVNEFETAAAGPRGTPLKSCTTSLASQHLEHILFIQNRLKSLMARLELSDTWFANLTDDETTPYSHLRPYMCTKCNSFQTQSYLDSVYALENQLCSQFEKQVGSPAVCSGLNIRSFKKITTCGSQNYFIWGYCTRYAEIFEAQGESLIAADLYKCAYCLAKILVGSFSSEALVLATLYWSCTNRSLDEVGKSPFSETDHWIIVLNELAYNYNMIGMSNEMIRAIDSVNQYLQGHTLPRCHLLEPYIDRFNNLGLRFQYQSEG